MTLENELPESQAIYGTCSDNNSRVESQRNISCGGVIVVPAS
jgi:hypothetical protein